MRPHDDHDRPSKGSAMALDLDALLAAHQPPLPSEAVVERVREQVTRSLKPHRGLSAGVRLGLSLAATVALTLLLLSSAWPRIVASPLLLAGTVGWIAVQAAVVLTALARPVGQRSSLGTRIALTAILPLVFFAYLAMTSTHWDSLSHAVHNHVLGCGLSAMTYAILISLTVLFAWRKTDPFSPAVSGAIAGLVGGLGGAVAIGLACPILEAWHLWLSHGSVIIMMTLAGSIAGRRWLTP